MQCKHVDVIRVKVLKDYELYLQFDDGSQGNVDISKLIPFKGVFEPLKNKDFFSKVSINSDIGTIYWENGADLSPTYLLENLKIKNA
ncbi:MAG: DUF2442 domain-containing protein [Pseudomonadota bacterium]